MMRAHTTGCVIAELFFFLQSAETACILSPFVDVFLSTAPLNETWISSEGQSFSTKHAAVTSQSAEPASHLGLFVFPAVRPPRPARSPRTPGTSRATRGPRHRAGSTRAVPPTRQRYEQSKRLYTTHFRGSANTSGPFPRREKINSTT